MYEKIRTQRFSAPAALCAVLVLVVGVMAGCSSSSDDVTNPPGPTGPQSYVSTSALTVNGDPSSLVVSIADALKATQVATAVLQVGVNELIAMAGTFNEGGAGQLILSDTGQTYSFIGTLQGATISGTFNGGGNNGTAVTLTETSVPLVGIVVLGSWDFTHSVEISASTKLADACSVPPDARNVTESCEDRYQVEVGVDTLPADACDGDCLPSIDLATGTIDGAKLTLFIPEMGETTPGRLFTLNLPDCNVFVTGNVEFDFLAETTELVDLDTECSSPGTECDAYCTDGKLDPDCSIDYELVLTRCEGSGCECPV